MLAGTIAKVGREKIYWKPHIILSFLFGFIEAELQTELVDFFPHTSCLFPVEYGRKGGGKIRPIPARNTASMNAPEPTVSLPDCSTWEVHLRYSNSGIGRNF